eukprot:jgi/Chlat1/1532/Chrsp122S01828
MVRKGRRSERTLACAVQALQGELVAVELRNDTVIKGHLEHADDAMNLTIKDAQVTPLQGQTRIHDAIFIKSDQVRFVHIPSSIIVRSAVEQQRKRRDDAESMYGQAKAAGGNQAQKPSLHPSESKAAQAGMQV